MPQPWTPAQIIQLQALWSDRKLYSASVIGDLLGRTRNSVIGRVNRCRYNEGEERWPRREDLPRRKYVVKQKEPKPPKERPKKSEPQEPKPTPRKIAPILPNEVTVGFSSRCAWVDCGKAKARGNYCTEHAERMYVPRRV